MVLKTKRTVRCACPYSKIIPMNPHDLIITRTLNAPRESVWKAWTDSKQVAAWWGPNGFTSPRCDWDAKAGGKIHIDMKDPEGAVYPMNGRFLEVLPPEFLSFLSAPLDDQGTPLLEVKTSATLIADKKKTKLTLKAVVVKTTPVGDSYLEGQSQGWNESLDRLTAFVEK